MKNKIICLALCVAALVFSMVLLIKTIEAPEINRDVKKEETKLPEKPVVPSGPQAVELTDTGVSAFASRIEAFVERLAWGGDKSYVDEREYIIENAERVSAWLLENNDKNGSLYMSTVADAFKASRDAFGSDEAFSLETSTILKNLDSARKKVLNAENSNLYPELDTEISGSLVLALFSIHTAQLQASLDPAETFTVTVGGAMLLGDRLGAVEDKSFKHYSDNSSNAYPLYKLSSVLSHDNATFMTLLNPLTESSDSEVLDPVKGSPAYAEALVGVDCVSLAPTEVMDYGETGYHDTVTALDAVGISSSSQAGTGTLDTAFGKVVYITYDLTDEEVSIAGKDRSVSKIRQAVEAERENGADLVVVMLHMNTRRRESTAFSADYLGTVISSYEQHFDAFNKEIARAAISAGADLVVGTGAHVLQGIELYRDKFIVYSPGDVSYSGSLDSEEANTAYSFLFTQTFKKENGENKTLSWRVVPFVNTSVDEPYAPTVVFDSSAETVVDMLKYQSSYFATPITDFNYIKIEK